MFSAQYNKILTNYLQQGVGLFVPNGLGSLMEVAGSFSMDGAESTEQLQLVQGAGGTYLVEEITSPLSLGIIYNPPDGFSLDIFNMTVGSLYSIGAKDSLDPDPFNTWTLVATPFIAEAPNEELSGSISAAKRFYRAINLDEYIGPTVSIVSPASGSTVSGDVPLQVQVTDILPLLSIKVYVDQVQVGFIQSGDKGIITVPTSWFPNGDHEIWVAVVNEGVLNDTDGDSIPDTVVPIQGWGNI